VLDFEDTILAVATPAGTAPRGIVRLSGPAALRLATAVFETDDPAAGMDGVGFRRSSGQLQLASADGSVRVPAERYVFRAPRSFTGQDCAELHTVGSPSLLNMLVAALVELGARRAEPGEFTARAFVSGRLDLSRAEAVAQLIAARSDAQLRAARRFADGELATRVSTLTGQLADLVALVEADIDFAEEPIEFIRPGELRERLAAIGADIEGLLFDASRADRADVLPRVLLLGRPNAGKSSLLNALSGLDRAICSATAGTTRDILSAPVKLPRGEAMLLDAAGLDDTPDGLLEQARARVGVEAETVDLICIVVDVAASSAGDGGSLQADIRALRAAARGGEGSGSRDRALMVVANKIDVLDSRETALRLTPLAELGLGPVCPTSARTGTGLDELKSALGRLLEDERSPASPDALQLNARQREAFSAARACLVRAADECATISQTAERADLIAFELREALDALGAVCGAVTTDDLLTRIFSSFCIGK